MTNIADSPVPYVHRGDNPPRHDPVFYRAAEVGVWWICTCGTRGEWFWGGIVSAHLEYARHLLATRTDPPATSLGGRP